MNGIFIDRDSCSFYVDCPLHGDFVIYWDDYFAGIPQQNEKSVGRTDFAGVHIGVYFLIMYHGTGFFYCIAYVE